MSKFYTEIIVKFFVPFDVSEINNIISLILKK